MELSVGASYFTHNCLYTPVLSGSSGVIVLYDKSNMFHTKQNTDLEGIFGKDVERRG